MNRRNFLRLLGVGSASLATQGCSTLAGKPFGTGIESKPNIVFIMADDLGYECLGCNGGTSYRTPNLDRLAASGVRFTNCFSTPLCTPTRMQVMTGQYPFRNGWPSGIWTFPREQWALDLTGPNFAHILRAGGYRTAVAGKWQLAFFQDHPDHARRSGFDEHCLWTWKYEEKKDGNEDGKKKISTPSRYWEPYVWENGKRNEAVKKEDSFGEDIFTDYLIDFFRRNKDRPFFAYYPMTLPHGPFVETPDTIGTEGNSKRSRQERFAGMVAYMDRKVGQIVSALDKLGLRENTLVVFTGDNGTCKKITTMMGKHVVKGGKGLMTDTGTHVPLVASWGGQAAKGAVCEHLIDLSDMLPTFVEAAGAQVPEDHFLDGRSFLPQIRGEKSNPRDWVFLQVDDNQAVRTHRWKLFANGKLFDIQNDPLERSPIRSDQDSKESKAVRKQLEAALKSLIGESS